VSPPTRAAAPAEADDRGDRQITGEGISSKRTPAGYCAQACSERWSIICPAACGLLLAAA
jgi:hypothetical protein